MLNLILGRSGSGKTALVRRMIKQNISDGDKVVLLVPEQETVAVESEMAEILPPSSGFSVEITNFTRLANSVFREYGGLADTLIDDAARSLITWRAMVSAWDKLTVYNQSSVGRDDKNISAILSAIDELKASGISPEDAALALDKLTEDTADSAASSLTARLCDITLIYSAYEELLHSEFIDRADLLSALAASLADHDYFDSKHVYIDSFFSLTAPEERILYQIMRSSASVTVTFACPPEDRGELEFGEVRDFYKKVLRLANRLSVIPKEIALTENHRHKSSPILAAIEKNLFGESPPSDVPSDTGGSVSVITTADYHDEAEAAASIISRLVREGYRYGEIAVTARNISTRDGILDSALRRHSIPCFISESGKVTSSPAVRLILTALSVAAGGWQRKDLVALIKTGLTGVGENGDYFEVYTKTWSIRGKRAYCGGDWQMNPAGYRANLTDGGKEILRHANEAKNTLIPPLARLLSLFDTGANVREIAEGIINYADEVNLTEKLASLAESYRAIGMPKDAALAESSRATLCKLLDKMVFSLGDTTLDAARFRGLLLRAAEKTEVGTIPTSSDEVVLGSSSGARFEGARAVIILGSSAGEFPAPPPSDTSFFSESDKIALEGVGITVSSPRPELLAAREYFMYYRCAAAPSEKLFILCPNTGESGTKPAAPAESIVKITGQSARPFSSMPLSETVFDIETAEYLLSRFPDDSREKKILSALTKYENYGTAPSAEERVTPKKLSSGEKMQLSQSKIDSFVQCPFSYSCKYLAKLYPEPKAEIKPLDIGNFVHAVLEEYFTALPKEGFSNKDEQKAFADRIISKTVDELRHASHGSPDSEGRLDYLFTRLKRHVLVFIEAITAELEQSKFTPWAHEYPIGETGDSIPALPLTSPSGVNVEIRGIVDRIDTYTEDGNTYIRIVDYKTGRKKFLLENVRRGMDIQLLLYLFSAWRMGSEKLSVEEGGKKTEVIPAGAVYFSLIPNQYSAEKPLTAEEAKARAIDKITRSGIFLADEDILRAMDSSLSGKYVGAKLKDGKLDAAAGTTLSTLDGFGELHRELSETVGKIADEISNGKSTAVPQITKDKNPCETCPTPWICRK